MLGRVQRALEHLLARKNIDEFHLRSRQGNMCRQEFERIDHRVLGCVVHGNFVDQYVVNGSVGAFLFESETARAVSLWIGIDQQHTLSFFRQTGAQIYGGRRFAHAAFLIGYRHNFHKRVFLQ
ncbi:hypothetical protein SDC9_131107 [bioreactor metagenome]|uniref:Uncharacterized protein n=1 Tax=bioreactor metagenome TaxID=1076179 RepID=A0A645D3T4_9ZZZZ